GSFPSNGGASLELIHRGVMGSSPKWGRVRKPVEEKQEWLTFDLYHSACLENTKPGIDQHCSLPDSTPPNSASPPTTSIITQSTRQHCNCVWSRCQLLSAGKSSSPCDVVVNKQWEKNAGSRFTFIAVGGLVTLSTRRAMNDNRVHARPRLLK
ncbi:hypothetical protein NQZ68_028949, partial [Dissostichus eleginoides]